MQKYVFKAYSDTFPGLFQTQKDLIASSVTEALAIEHIGSTAIPNLGGKGIIDIAIAIDKKDTQTVLEKLEKLGFEFRAPHSNLERLFFRADLQDLIEGIRRYHIHLMYFESPDWKRFIAFRDHLRNHPEDAEEYAALKKMAAETSQEDGEKYRKIKEPLFKKIEALTSFQTDPICQSMQSNTLFHMTYFANAIPEMELLHFPDITVVRSNIIDDTFNYAIFASFQEEEAKDRVHEVIELFKSLGLPFSWWVSPSDTPSNLTEVIESQGLVFKEQDVGMALSLEEFPKNTQLSPLIFKQVHSLELLEEFFSVITQIGGNPEAFDRLYRHTPLKLIEKGAPLEMHIGYLDGKPAVTGILVFHADVAGIYYVATNPSQRNKGFGTAMMRHLLAIAKEKGYLTAVLQASHEGKNLYERLGFKEKCIFKEYGLA